jgi:hypothetical protein
MIQKTENITEIDLNKIVYSSLNQFDAYCFQYLKINYTIN